MKKLLSGLAFMTVMFMLFFMGGRTTAEAANVIKEITPDTEMNDSLSAGDQVNIYKVKVDERGYQTLEFRPDLTRTKNTDTGIEHFGWNIKIYDREKKTSFEIKEVKGNFNSDKFMFAEETEMFIEVFANNSYFYPDNVNYTLKLNTVASDDYEVEDNDSISKATEISLEKPLTGNMTTCDDEDYFMYNFNKDGVISVKFEIPDFNANKVKDGWNISVYNKDKKMISEYKKVTNDMELSELSFKKGETVYIRVKSYWNTSQFSPELVDYKLTLSYGNASKWEIEYNDTFNTANKLNGTKTGLFMNGEDTDVYYFSAAKTKNYKVKVDTGDNMEKEYSIEIFVKNKDKTVISESFTTNKTFTIKAKKGNKVWIKIKANYSFNPPVGKYKISVK